MELPQPRPFGAEDRKPTHDFLSLYSPVQQDPRPPSQGGYLKTHDFLQPLERVGNNNAKEDNTVKKTTLEKPPLSAPPPSVGHLLPGGIGTYSISHVSYFNPTVPKPEGSIFTVAQASSTEINEENSNCSSYTGSGFTLWEETVVKKGKTGKENIAGDNHVSRDAGVKIGGQWTPSERASQSFSSYHNNTTSFSSLSSPQPSSGQKNQSFMDMAKSARGAHEVDDDDDEEFVFKKEPSSHYKGNLTVKVDGKSTEQKANTPRSKHSATEQRRRSKINDRFQMLREIIPHADQKRDKASFLLEVIEYIQFLQEKVHKYEGSYQGWNHDPAKLMAWRNGQSPAEGFVDQTRGVMFATKVEESNLAVSPTIPRNQQNQVESDMSTATTFKAMEHHPGFTAKVVPLPITLQPNIFTPGRTSGPRLASDAENKSSQPQSQSLQSRSCTTDCAVVSDKLKEQELTIENGTISISSVYSQGLLNTLTKALQGSGVDLSQASISVQIDLGKRANSRLSAPICIAKDEEVPSKNPMMTRSRVASTMEDSDQALKRLKTGRN